MGRPTSLTPERHQAIVGSVQRGLSPERAAEAAGIDPRTYYRWMARGDEDLQHNHPDPEKFTLPQLRALAADQEVTLPPRCTRAQAAALLIVPTPYSQFRQDMKTADAASEDYAVAQAMRTGSEQWTFWVTYLERRWPERWARRAPVDIPATPTGQHAVDPAAALEAGRARLKVVEGGQ